MPLTLDTREVGSVTVVRCCGRIVAGKEAEDLRLHIAELLRDRRDLVLHLGEVVFIDSSGLGTIVRLLASTRKSRGDLKLCNVPPLVGKVLKTTNLTSLFDTHESEEGAISAFYRRSAQPQPLASTGRLALCIDQSTDVLAYLRELMARGGYNVQTSNNLRDGLILLRVTRPAVLVLGANLAAAPAVRQAFDTLCAGVPVIQLEPEFSTQDAGEAGAQLLDLIQARLGVKQGLPS